MKVNSPFAIFKKMEPLTFTVSLVIIICVEIKVSGLIDFVFDFR